jgi:hypothetical protein
MFQQKSLEFFWNVSKGISLTLEGRVDFMDRFDPKEILWQR